MRMTCASQLSKEQHALFRVDALYCLLVIREELQNLVYNKQFNNLGC